MNKNVKKDDEVLLNQIHKNIDKWYSYFSENIRRYKEYKKFTFEEDGQWDENVKYEYDTLYNKPRMTINLCKDFVNKLVGEQRSNTSNFKVKPILNINENSDEKIVEMVSNYLRTISYSSNAKNQYQIAFKNALVGGFAAFRIYTDYEHDNSFDQKPFIEAVKNPLQAFFDPSAQNQCKDDGMFSGVFYYMDVDKFKKKYNKSDHNLGFINNNITNTGGLFNWYDNDQIAICEYACKRQIKKTIYQLNNGIVVDKNDYERDMFSQRFSVVNERIVNTYVVDIYKVIHNEILEKTTWKINFLPHIYLDGNSWIDDNGIQNVIPIVMYARDAQRFINFIVSTSADAMRKAQDGKNVISLEEMEGFEEYWRDVNNNSNILPYNAVDGRQPYFKNPTQISTEFFNAFTLMSSIIPNLFGMYSSNLGQIVDKTSGTAFNAATRQGNLSNFEYFDNLRIAQEVIGKIILNLLPVLYTNPRRIMLTKPNDETNDQLINTGQNNNINKMIYNVEVTGGTSSELQKEQALNLLYGYLKLDPSSIPYLRDLVTRNFDIENQPEITKRVKMMPDTKQVLMEEQGIPKQPSPPNPMLMLEKQQIQSDSLRAHNDSIKAAAAMTNANAKLLKTKSDIEHQDHKVLTERMKTHAEIGKAQLQYEQQMMKNVVELQKTKSK